MIKITTSETSVNLDKYETYEDNIKMSLKQFGSGGSRWVESDQDLPSASSSCWPLF
jgi:hypothetical protein